MMRERLACKLRAHNLWPDRAVQNIGRKVVSFSPRGQPVLSPALEFSGEHPSIGCLVRG